VLAGETFAAIGFAHRSLGASYWIRSWFVARVSDRPYDRALDFRTRCSSSSTLNIVLIEGGRRRPVRCRRCTGIGHAGRSVVTAIVVSGAGSTCDVR